MLASPAEAGSEVYVSVRGKLAEAVPEVARDGTQLMNKCVYVIVIIAYVNPYVEKACCSLPVGEYPAGDLE